MPEFYDVRMFAALTVRDPRSSARWYGEALGFETVLEVDDPPEGPATAHLRRGRYQDLLLVAPPGDAAGVRGGPRHPSPSSGVTLNFVVEDDVDDLASRAEAMGGCIVQGPLERYYDAREVVLEDPEGHRLVFARFHHPQRAAEVVMAMHAAHHARGGDSTA